MKKKPDRKKELQQKKVSYVFLQHLRTDSPFMWMKSVLNLSWWRSVSYRNKSNLFAEQINELVSIRQEPPSSRVKALLLACIHWEIFLDYNKITVTYASKYQTRMHLINPLNKNANNATKTHKVYIELGIFSLYFIVVICKNFRFALTN